MKKDRHMHMKVATAGLLFGAALFGSAFAAPSAEEILTESTLAYTQACATCGKSKEVNEKLVLVIGCPRAGTGYIWKVLRVCGIRVGHEKDGEGGIVSWLFAA